MGFYHNRVISPRAMFDKCTDYMEKTWWWPNLFFSFSRTIFWETSMEVDFETVNIIVRNKWTTILHGQCSYRQYNAVKIFKTLQWNFSPAGHGSTRVLNTLMSFLWSIRVRTMENCCWFVKFLKKSNLWGSLLNEGEIEGTFKKWSHFDQGLWS